MKQHTSESHGTSEQVVKDIRRATRKQYSAEEKIGVPPLKWSTVWDRIIPFSGGGRDGMQARETRGYHCEASAG